MLPRILSEDLCSLNAGVDRLTFSVVFKLSDSGDVHEEWFGRTIIRSCGKLTYEHAQVDVLYIWEACASNVIVFFRNEVTVFSFEMTVLFYSTIIAVLQSFE